MADPSAHQSTLDELVTRPLADIARELATLRQENAHLQERAEYLNGQVETLTPICEIITKENVVLRGAVKALMRDGGFLNPLKPLRPPHINAFPPEILLRIFRMAYAPSHEHDPSAMRPYNHWQGEIRFRKSLVLICTAWSGPATAALYEEVVLWRMGQIAALARTLFSDAVESGGSGRLAALIRRLGFDGCVVWAPCADAVRADLLRILLRCTALHAFAFTPDLNFPSAIAPAVEDRSWEGFNPAWLFHDHTDDFGRILKARLSSGLRELDLSMPLKTAEVRELHYLLSAAKYLRVLKLNSISEQDLLVELRDLPTITLPDLAELQFSVGRAFFVDLVATWSLPRLTQLTLLGCQLVPVHLLEVHGAHLTYLHLFPAKKERTYDYSWLPFARGGLERVGALCPALEHLAFPLTHPDDAGAADALQSRTLRFLDLWCHGCAADRAEVAGARAALAVAERLPALERVRHLRRVVHVDLPRVCHPADVGDGDGDGGEGAPATRTVRFPCSVVVQTAWCVAPDSRFWRDVPCFAHINAEEDDEGTDSTFSSEDSDSSDDEDEEASEEKDEDGGDDDDGDDGNYEPQEFVPETESESETDWSVSDDESDAMISDWEQNHVAAMEEQLERSLDQDEVLAIFDAQHEDESSETGSEVEGDGRT